MNMEISTLDKKIKLIIQSWLELNQDNSEEILRKIEPLTKDLLLEIWKSLNVENNLLRQNIISDQEIKDAIDALEILAEDGDLMAKEEIIRLKMELEQRRHINAINQLFEKQKNSRLDRDDENPPGWNEWEHGSKH
jgi:hypothetical protein